MDGLSKEKEKMALKLHNEAVFFDACSITILDGVFDIFSSMQKGGITAILRTVGTHDNRGDTIKEISHMYRLIDENRDRVLLASSTRDIIKAKKNGKIAIFLGFQSPYPIEYDIYLLRIFYKLGIRCMTLAYDRKGSCADGCREPSNSELSNFGIQVVEEMNRLGMLIDLTHVGVKSALHTIETSKDPVAFTHSNAWSLVPQPQNRTDEEIKALAEKKGVIGVTTFPRLAYKGKDWRRSRPTLDMVLDHIDYITNLVGTDYVGLGLHVLEGWKNYPQVLSLLKRNDGTVDFDFPEEINTMAKTPNITKGLVARGYSNQDIKKIIGGNWVRLFKQVTG